MKRLNCDPTEDKNQSKVTPDQVASCLIRNGKFGKEKSDPIPKRSSCNMSITSQPFNMEELTVAKPENRQSLWSGRCFQRANNPLWSHGGHLVTQLPV